LARAYLKLGDKEKVRGLLDALISDPAATSGAYNKYAWFSFKQGYDRPRGIEVAKMGLEKNPKDDGLWDTLAELYYAEGDAKKAIEAEDKAIALDPSESYYTEQKAKFSK
jgi:tetratricopeptide (TPR) repeat protein